MSYVRHLKRKYDVQTTQVVQGALILSTLYLICDYLWYLALAHTSVAIATSIYNSSCVFIYVFSCLFLKEPLVWKKSIGVASTVAGVFLVSMSHSIGTEKNENESSLEANVIVLISTMAYATYEITTNVVLSKMNKAPQVVNIVSACMGLCSLVFWIGGSFLINQIPETWLFHEPFEWPTTQDLPILFINAGFAFIFNLCLMFSLIYTSPLTVAVACVTTIPLSAILDWILYHDPLTLEQFFGSCFILIGFFLTNTLL